MNKTIRRNNKTKYLRKRSNRKSDGDHVTLGGRTTLGGRVTLKRKSTKKKPQKKVTFKTSPEYIYGKIYATWCGHCQVLEPEWKKVEESLYPNKSINIESAESEKLIRDFNTHYTKKLKINVYLKANGYPTIFKLNKIGGNVEYYEGNRSHGEILDWIKKDNMSHNENNNTSNNENTNTKNWFF
jgi:thiol-disulfide isomerase/thioredoxin